MTSALAFLFVLGVVVGFHEFGHFLTMKLFGVKVIRFCFGFGPRIFSAQLGETEYRVSLFPLGGYVMPLQKDLPEEFKRFHEPYYPERYMEAIAPWKRLLTFLAGPFSNLFLALVLYIGLFWIKGLAVPTTELQYIFPDSPASQSEILIGDKIINVNEQEINAWEEVVLKIKESNGKPLRFLLERNKKIISVIVVPKLDNESGEGKCVIGVSPKFNFVRKGIRSAANLGYRRLSEDLKQLFGFIRKAIQGKASADSVGGPIMIYQISSEAARQGFEVLIFLIIQINLSLFLFNLLPIPVFDGGQIYPVIFEMLTGIKPSKKFMRIWQMVGIGLVLLLLAFTTFNDIRRMSVK